MKISSEKMALGSLAMAMLLASLGVSIPNIILPSLAKQFDAPISQVQLIILSYLLSITVMIVSVGKLGDLIGRKKIYLIGTTLFAMAALLSGLAQSLWIIIAARAIQGLGAAIIMAMAIALISESVSKEKTGSAMGLMGTMSAVGTASGPSIGGFLIDSFGWRSVFILIALLGLLSFLLSRQFIPEEIKNDSRKKPEQFDIIGTLVLGVSLTTYSIGVTLNGGHFNLYNYLLVAVAIITGMTFFFIEKVIHSPLLRFDLFQKNNLFSNLLMNTIVSTVMMSTLVVGPFYLSRGLTMEPLMVGAVMSVGPILSILSGIPAGRLVDFFGSGKVAKCGLILMILGTVSLSLLPYFYGLIGYILSVVILSPGYQMFQAANNTAVMEKVDKDERGVISGLLSLSRNIGLISGASIMGALFSFSTGTSQISEALPSDLIRGVKVTFAFASALVVIAIVISQLSSPRQS